MKDKGEKKKDLPISSEKWQRVITVFLDAIETEEMRREEFICESCAGDVEVKKEVKKLLEAHFAAAKFIEKPAVEIFVLSKSDNGAKTAKNFGNYKIIREIGAGGMGAVFLAERNDGEFTQKAAIKIVRQAIAEKELINRFRRERQILALLNHPNIAHLLDGGVTENGEPFLVMEYVEGAPLLEFTANLGIEERLKLFLKICAAVSFAHRNLIVHRDLKPSNVLVTKDGEPKLLDFGLAKILDFQLDAVQTATAFRAFTPAYASLEQLRGETVTTASDIYSLGVVLYELLTGKQPFEYRGKSLEEIIRLATTSEPVRPSAFLSRSSANENSVSPNENQRTNGDRQRTKSPKTELDFIVLMALRKEPERRYKSIEAFAEDIENYLNGLPVSARPNTFLYRTGKFVKRNRVGVFAGLLIFLAIISGSIVSLRQAEIARRERDLTQAQKLKAERINQFLQKMLSFSDQSSFSFAPTTQSRNVTVNEMLEQIAPQIKTEFADQPEVRAQILRTVGSSYASQGRYEEAEKNLREAITIQTEIFGDRHIETALTEFIYGSVLFSQTKFDEAVLLFDKLASVQREFQKSNSVEFKPAQLADALCGIGTAKFFAGERQDGLANLNEALQIATNANLQGKQRETLAAIQTNLGGILVRLGELEKGETLLRQSLAEYCQISGAPHWEFGATLTTLGELLIAKNQPAEAEKFLAEGEQIYRQTLGDKNVFLGYNLLEQSIALGHENDYKKAEAKARECLAIYQAVLPAENSNLAAAKRNLGTILTRAGRVREGEDYLRQSSRKY